MSEQMKKLSVVSHTFQGEENGLFSYEITFNQSLQHTGTFQGIETGWTDYVRRESMPSPDHVMMDVLGRVHDMYCDLTKDDQRAKEIDNEDWAHHMRALQRLVAGRIFKNQNPDV